MLAVEYCVVGLCGKLPVLTDRLGENLIWHFLLKKLVDWIIKVSQGTPKYSNLVPMENTFYIMSRIEGMI